LKTGAAILNVCFEMCIAFGPTLGLPLAPRIKEKFSLLTDSEINRIVKECEHARKKGYKFVNDRGAMIHTSSQKLHTEFVHYIKSECDWMDDNNISHLYSQSCYVAMK
jgi:hypothetical protein